MPDTVINATQLAAKLGVGMRAFRSMRRHFANLPQPINPGKIRPTLWRVADIDAWLASEPRLVAILADGTRHWHWKRKLDPAAKLAPANPPSPQPIHPLAKAWLSGQLDPPAKQKVYALRRLTARATQPQTTKISLTSDWFDGY